MKWLKILFWADIALIWGWLALRFGVGDRLGIVASLDMFALYYFAPLPFLLPVIAFTRKTNLWIAWASCVLVFLWFWHGLLVRTDGYGTPPGPTLRVMTYNVLGIHNDYEPLIANIREADPDVVLLQEVNPEFADVLESDMIEEYPFQILDPQPGVRGMGTISKYPIEPTGEELELVWIGTPQLLSLDWNGTRVQIVNFHTLPPRISWEKNMRKNVQYRNEQARALAAYARERQDSIPLIVAGDLNATNVSTAHGILSENLRDAWYAGGTGLGHTFPNASVGMQGVPVPRLLFRIDYIFVSPEVRTARAFLGGATGSSDHRGVVADLYISPGS